MTGDRLFPPPARCPAFWSSQSRIFKGNVSMQRSAVVVTRAAMLVMRLRRAGLGSTGLSCARFSGTAFCVATRSGATGTLCICGRSGNSHSDGKAAGDGEERSELAGVHDVFPFSFQVDGGLVMNACSTLRGARFGGAMLGHATLRSALLGGARFGGAVRCCARRPRARLDCIARRSLIGHGRACWRLRRTFSVFRAGRRGDCQATHYRQHRS